MSAMSTFRSLLVAAALMPWPGLAQVHAIEVDSRQIWIEPRAESAPDWRLPATAWSGDDQSLTLYPIAAEKIEAVRSYNSEPGAKALKIGIARDLLDEPGTLGLSSLRWEEVDAGVVASLIVVSPGAEGLRLGLDLADMADDDELRVAGSAFPDLIYLSTVAEARQQLDAEGRYWTPITDGEEQRLEVYSANGGARAPAIVAVSHLLVGLHGDADLSKALKNAGSCNIDVACRLPTLGQSFGIAKNAVARMSFTTGGSTGLCSGTLLNDTQGSQRKWFFSAHHCVGNQAEANTVSTWWQHETPTCGSSQNGPNRQMTGGADRRYGSVSSDGLLLELRGSFPDGIPIAFAGWSAQALTANTSITGIHHPQGDRKKVSRGTFNRVTAFQFLDTGNIVQSTWRVNWSEGTTEIGSSGSGLFTSDANSFFLRGGLVGGNASCSNSGQGDGSGNWDSYSRFDQIFPSIQQFIAPSGGGSNGPTRDYTGAWNVATESGRGLTLYQYPQNNNQLFAVWFVYDSQGRASWYQLDPSWTGQDVASGRVVRWTGPAWGPSYNPANRSFVEVGNFTLTFTGSAAANFSYNVDGVNRTVTLRKLGD